MAVRKHLVKKKVQVSFMACNCMYTGMCLSVSEYYDILAVLTTVYVYVFQTCGGMTRPYYWC